jgi:DNA-directed RNA polymerase III subunit RPC5
VASDGQLQCSFREHGADKEADSLHLTPATNHVQLRTQLHHLDALTEQDRQSRQGTSTGGASGQPTTAATGGQDGKPASAARAIHMTVKAPTGTEDALTTETMADRLRRVQREPWVRMSYADENSDEAWAVYTESLLVHPDPAIEAGRAKANGPSGKGKGVETAIAEGELKDKVPQLEARWGDEEFLQAVSGMQGRIGGVKQEKVEDDGVEVKPDPDGSKSKGKSKEVPIKVEDDAPTVKPRRGGKTARGGSHVSAAPTSTRASSGKAAKGGQASTPMEID